MEFLSEYGLFLLKALTIVICLVALLLVFVKAVRGPHLSREGRLKVVRLNKHFRDLREAIEEKILDGDRFKALLKQRFKEEKNRRRSGSSKKNSDESATPDDKKDQESNNGAQSESGKAQSGKGENQETRGGGSVEGNVYVIDFDGDLRASAVENLREEISALVATAKGGDEVVLRLESSGGLVHNYGLAASQLLRLKQKKIKLTVCVDRIAASGGYMMACVADRIVAAPFAVVGSIGVAATLPNFNRFLEGHQIDVEQITAGEYKRTLSLVGKNTEKGRAKFTEQVEQTHELFKEFVAQNRPGLQMSSVASGEHWYGSQAKELGLVDELGTSDDILLGAGDVKDVFKISFERPKSIPDRIGSLASNTLRSVFRAGVDSARGSVDL